jgi:hypothetical protein
MTWMFNADVESGAALHVVALGKPLGACRCFWLCTSAIFGWNPFEHVTLSAGDYSQTSDFLHSLIIE